VDINWSITMRQMKKLVCSYSYKNTSSGCNFTTNYYLAIQGLKDDQVLVGSRYFTEGND